MDRTGQYAAYFLLSLLMLTFTIILLPSSGGYFRKYLGEMNAIVVFALTSVAGAAALWVLQSKFNFVIFLGARTLRGLALSAVLATLLGIAIVIADYFIRYPQDTNVPVPQALLFYPAVGFVAELIFHVIPLALLLLILNPLGGSIGEGRVMWIAILLVATVEPAFQVLFEGKPFTWGAAYTFVHVFTISFLQLYVFWRYDFISMYSFRLFYYAYWHILWGVIRLRVLF